MAWSNTALMVAGELVTTLPAAGVRATTCGGALGALGLGLGAPSEIHWRILLTSFEDRKGPPSGIWPPTAAVP